MGSARVKAVVITVTTDEGDVTWRYGADAEIKRSRTVEVVNGHLHCGDVFTTVIVGRLDDDPTPPDRPDPQPPTTDR